MEILYSSPSDIAASSSASAASTSSAGLRSRSDHTGDHPVEPHRSTIIGAEDTRHAVVVQLLDLARDDDASAAAIDLDVPPHAGAADTPCT